jgi:hypothetical protein
MPYPPVIQWNVTFNDALPAINRPKKRHVVKRVQFAFSSSFGNTANQDHVGVENLKVRSVQTGARLSDSFGRQHDNLSEHSGKRFAFAPGVEDLEITWKVSGRVHITDLRFELIGTVREGGGINSRTLWTRDLQWTGVNAGNCPAEGTIVFNGDLGAAPVFAGGGVENLGGAASNITPLVADPNFPGDILNVRYAPYKLKLTVIDPTNTLYIDKPAAFVYLDVLVSKVTLDWGPRNVLAASAHIGLPPTERDHLVYDELLDANGELGGAVPAPGQKKKVLLPWTNFSTDDAQWLDMTAYDTHRATWGDGPNIPIFARVQVANSNGAAVDAPRALAGLQLIWDWEDATAPLAIASPFREKGAVEGFVNAAQDFDQNVAGQPQGMSCHLERGGKRGAGAARVLPDQAAPGANPVPPNTFPFQVAHNLLAQRTWSAITEVQTTGTITGVGGPAGNLESKSGVIFQPSRMGGDAYKLHVCVVYPDLAAYDVTNLRNLTSLVPQQLRASTGIFEMWRLLKVQMHARAANYVPALDWAQITAHFDPAFLHLDTQPATPLNAGNWQTSVANTALLLPWYLRPALHGPHGTNTCALHFRDHPNYLVNIALTVHGIAGAANEAVNPGRAQDQLGAFVLNQEYVDSNDYGASLGRKWPRYILPDVMTDYAGAGAGAGLYILHVDHFSFYPPNNTTFGGTAAFAIYDRNRNANKVFLIITAGTAGENSTAAHEIGHGLFLNHMIPCQGQTRAAVDPNNLHQTDAEMSWCLMSYQQGGGGAAERVHRHLCGACVLRLRGWSHEQTNAAGARIAPAVTRIHQATAANSR